MDNKENDTIGRMSLPYYMSFAGIVLENTTQALGGRVVT